MGSWGEQFSTGDQSNDVRQNFYESQFKVCQKCKAGNIEKNTTPAGCRHNGDGYGTEVFKCLDCGWETSFMYDEGGDSYYYELSQKRSHSTPKQTYDQLGEHRKLYYWKQYQKIPEDGLRRMMLLERISPTDIDLFFENILIDIATARRDGILIDEEKQKEAISTTLTPELKKKYDKIRTLIPEAECRANMKDDGIIQSDIEDFFRM